MTLSGILDTDLIILNSLSLADLLNMCSTDQYHYQLCQGNKLWQNRIMLEFGRDYTVTKPTELTWRRWYFWLYAHPPAEDIISQRLQLDIVQTYIRQYSEKDVTYASIKYQSPSVLLPLALQKNDVQLINFIIALIDTSTKYPLSITGFERSFEAAPHNKFLISLTRYNDEYRDIASRILGRYNDQSTFVNRLLPKYQTDITGYIWYIKGLLEAKHYHQVISLLGQYPDSLAELVNFASGHVYVADEELRRVLFSWQNIDAPAVMIALLQGQHVDDKHLSTPLLVAISDYLNKGIELTENDLESFESFLRKYQLGKEVDITKFYAYLDYFLANDIAFNAANMSKDQFKQLLAANKEWLYDAYLFLERDYAKLNLLLTHVKHNTQNDYYYNILELAAESGAIDLVEYIASFLSTEEIEQALYPSKYIDPVIAKLLLH